MQNSTIDCDFVKKITDKNLKLWMGLINQNYGYLLQGCKYAIDLPAGFPHPSISGFKKIDIAENFGQKADYGLSMTDESRIHVYEYANGKFRMHRDKYDPDASLSNMALHLVTESPTAKTLGILVLGIGLVSLVLFKGKIRA